MINICALTHKFYLEVILPIVIIFIPHISVIEDVLHTLTLHSLNLKSVLEQSVLSVPAVTL